MINKFDNQTFLLAKVINPDNRDRDKYFTPVHASVAPELITKQIAQELFAVRGGQVRFIYVVKPLDQKLTVPEHFLLKDQLIEIKEFAESKQANPTILYIAQFIAFANLSTDGFATNDYESTIKEMKIICETARPVNIIRTFIEKVIDINELD